MARRRFVVTDRETYSFLVHRDPVSWWVRAFAAIAVFAAFVRGLRKRRP